MKELYYTKKIRCSVVYACFVYIFLSKIHHFALIIAKTQFKDNQSMIIWDMTLTLNMYQNNELFPLHDQGYLL